ncbi:MAG: hypothetical protein U0R51_01540 [Solirubrobacterales bacterium]
MRRRAKIGSAVALAFACVLSVFALTALGRDATTTTSTPDPVATPADLADELDKDTGTDVQKDGLDTGPTTADTHAHGKKGGPDIVRVGALINDIQQLDLKTHSYNVDMYLWFKWTNPDINPTRTFEFLNAYEFWGHILTRETEKPEVLPDGTFYQVVRNQGQFNTKLPLERYPFDTQHLKMEFEDAHEDETGLRFVPDKDPVAVSKQLAIPGWDIGEPTLTVVSNRYDSNFGDPRLNDTTYSRAVIDLPLTRPAATYALKLLLPMLLVAMTAALSLMVHPKYVEGRIGIGITALLTLVALQITSNDDLPEVDYLILLDKLYIVSYTFVVLTMAMIVRNSWVDASGDVPAAIKADRRGLALLTGSYVVVVALLMVFTLT